MVRDLLGGRYVTANSDPALTSPSLSFSPLPISGLYDAHERFNRVALAVNGKCTGVDGTWVSIIGLYVW